MLQSRLAVPTDTFNAEEGFVNEGRGLEYVTGSLGCDVATGYAARFSVDQRRELIQGHPITVVPGDEQLSDLVGRRGLL